jgi:molybdenum cofactor cytidylyltransferase
MRRIGALILAAGGSIRFGEPKQLLNFRGKSLVRRVVEAAAGAKCEPIVVVAGNASDLVGERVGNCEIIRNAQWQRGIGSSIKCGVERLRGSVDAVVILACDQPFVTASVVKELIAHDAPIVASGYAEAVGIPALFASRYFDALASLPDETGAKSVIAAHTSDVAVVPFAEGVIDIDTRADYERALKHAADRPARSRS